MSDLDLAQALDCSPEYRFPFCDMEQNVKDEVFELSEDLDLLVRHNRKTMKSIANLVLAVNKLSKSLSQCGRELSDNELCSSIMDCVVEETVFQKGCESYKGQEKHIFLPSNCVKRFKLCDKNQKDLLLDQGKLKLQAITLTGGNCDRKVCFEMRSYIPPSNSSFNSMIVLLSVNRDLHISCSMTNGKISLDLEKKSMENLKEISTDGDMERFLFIKNTYGVSLATFESVRYRSWFISTSSENSDQSVEMCQTDAASRVTSFKVF